MEQAVNSLIGNPIVDSLVKPLIRKNIKILSPGIWTGTDQRPTIYTSEEIEKGFLNSDWSNMNLYLDHMDTKKTAVAYWIGFVRNARMEDGVLVGDLEIWHPLISMFMEQAKARFAVSATMNGNETMGLPGEPSHYRINDFQSISIVDSPGDAGAWIPKMLAKGAPEGSKTVTSGVMEEVKEETEEEVEETNDNDKKELASDKDKKEYQAPKDDNINNPSQKKSAMNKIVHSTDKPKAKVSEQSSKKELESYKEVKKMTEEKTEVKIEEEQTEETETTTEDSKETEAKAEETEEVEEVVEETKVEEEAPVAETKTEENSSDVKELSAKVDSLADSVGKLTSLVQKSLSAGENSEKETKEESEESENTEEPVVDAENAELKEELEETKKELAAAKAELDSPDSKTLSRGDESTDVNMNDANVGMMNFLRAQSHMI